MVVVNTRNIIMKESVTNIPFGDKVISNRSHLHEGVQQQVL